MTPPFSIGGDSQAELREWLYDKPFDWGSGIATRAALRAFPWAFASASAEWIERFALPVFHSLLVAWTTHNSPIKGHKFAAEMSATILYPAAMYPRYEAFYASGMRSISSAISSKDKVNKVDFSVKAVSAFAKLVASAVGDSSSVQLIWDGVADDIALLQSRQTSKSSDVRRLMVSSLINGHIPAWKVNLDRALENIETHDRTFELWSRWLSRAVSGKVINFHDASSAADAGTRDRIVNTSIIQNLDVQFWHQSSKAINEHIADLIRTAGLADDRVRAQVPPQNENAIAFTSNERGQIELTDFSSALNLRDDHETNDRYVECLDLAKAVLSICEGSNAASRLSRLIENYINAAGSNSSELRESLFVQRGERLRQELKAYSRPDIMLPPLSDEILLDLQAWQSAHNLFVGLDPSLMAKDIALRGPDSRVAVVPPSEIKSVAQDADESGILVDDVIDVVLEAADLAPDNPDPRDRRTIWSFETGRNLIIEAFNVALRYPGKTAVGTIVAGSGMATAGVAGTVVALAAGSIPAARFLLRHRDWIETRLGDTPTWRALFASLCESLEKIEPLRDDK